MLTCLIEEAMLDPEQDIDASLQRVREIFTKYT